MRRARSLHRRRPRRGSPADAAFYKIASRILPRHVVDATPSADSDIKIEIWLPASGWNGKLQGNGNGGFAGEIDYAELGRAIAAQATRPSAPTRATPGKAPTRVGRLNHPEKITDFAYRGIHEMTVAAKAAVSTRFTAAVRSILISRAVRTGADRL